MRVSEPQAEKALDSSARIRTHSPLQGTVAAHSGEALQKSSRKGIRALPSEGLVSLSETDI